MPRIHQSICAWCYEDKLTREKLCQLAAKIGYRGIDLVDASWLDLLAKYHLTGTMITSHSIAKGLNRRENWPECLAKIREGIAVAAAAGLPNVICFSGNREGMSDEEGVTNCAAAIKQVVGLAEQKGVTLIMELLNSRVDHPDYMCDRTPWGVRLVRQVASPRFKLLYDIYHMQIDEGDIIATIRAHHDCIGHYHTGGVPGRNEIGALQELNYPAIMRAIAATGYTGWVAQEFLPTGDPESSLAEAFGICDV